MDMNRLSIAFTPNPELAAAQALVDTALAQGAESLMLLAADANGCHKQPFDPWLRQLSVPVCGGVFPQIIHDWQSHTHGYIVVGLPAPIMVHSIPGLSDVTVDFFKLLQSLFGHEEPPPSLMVLVDGLSSRIGALLDAVYDILGSNLVYFGGGAGSLSFQSQPCLFSNQGLLTHHAQLIGLPWRFSLGVEHGWQKYAGPFVVTASTRNVIHTLDFQPALTVYREYVEADSGRKLSTDSFFEIAKAYPFGMEKADGSILVRDPIHCINHDLHCVGEVAVNSLVHVLKGQKDSLITAAAQGASAISGGTGPAILADCVSRALFLQEDFINELNAIQQVLDQRPLFGMLTLGEIANGGGICLEFYNKTLVLVATQE